MDAWELADAVGRGIDEAFAAATGEMVTQWVAVVEFMDADEQHAAVTEEAP